MLLRRKNLNHRISFYPKSNLSQKIKSYSNLDCNTFVDCGKSIKTEIIVKEEQLYDHLSDPIEKDNDPLFISKPSTSNEKYNSDKNKVEVNKQIKIEKDNTELFDESENEDAIDYVDYENVHIDDIKNDVMELCDVPDNATFKYPSASLDDQVDYADDNEDEDQLEFDDIDKVIETMSVEDAIAFFSK